MLKAVRTRWLVAAGASVVVAAAGTAAALSADGPSRPVAAVNTHSASVLTTPAAVATSPSVPITPAPSTSSPPVTVAPMTTPDAPAPRSPSPPPPAAVAPAAAPPAGNPLPLPYSGSAGQVITVVVGSSSATVGTLTAWSRNANGNWTSTYGPVTAFVGADGVGTASESTSRTPSGVYGLTLAFGRYPNPGTRLSYFQSTTSDWWDENPASPTYNTHVRQQNSPGGNSENLYTTGSVYNYAINVDYNTARTPGAGSAIFLHVSNGSPTAGCIAINQTTLVSIMRWLDPGEHPVIDIGVG